MPILLATLPLFIIILIGFLLARYKFFSAESANSLAKLIFYIIMPVTLFVDIANLPISHLINWPYMSAYFVNSVILMSVAILISKKYFHENASGMILNAMATTQTNTAYLALPLFLLLYKTVIPVAGIILVQSIFNFVIVFSLEFASHRRRSHFNIAIMTIVKTPILIGIVLGVMVSYFHLSLPSLINNTFDIVKQSASFVALLTLGLSLGNIYQRFSTLEKTETIFLIIMKAFVQPFTAFLIGGYIFHLSKTNLLYLTLMAAMPTAKNLFIFAKRYKVGERRANMVVIVTTLLSIITLNFILFL